MYCVYIYDPERQQSMMIILRLNPEGPSALCRRMRFATSACNHATPLSTAKLISLFWCFSVVYDVIECILWVIIVECNCWVCPEVRASLSVVSLFFVLFCGCGLLEVLEMWRRVWCWVTPFWRTMFQTFSGYSLVFPMWHVSLTYLILQISLRQPVTRNQILELQRFLFV